VPRNHTESVAPAAVASETYALKRWSVFAIPMNALLPASAPVYWDVTADAYAGAASATSTSTTASRRI
jgi:hypothetical protein